ncbi:MAG: class I SAM-dependent methyltransferase [Magnetococcus sp. MYC-9]
MAAPKITVQEFIAMVEKSNLNYYANYNGNLLNRIPASARKILDIGCGAGALGYLAKQRNPDVVYCGVELIEAAARIAETHLDQTYCANIETDPLPLGKEAFDCIIFGDVLEHLYHPLETLKRLKESLTAEGCVLCCIPNMQHYSIFETLICGEFQYQEGGLLDKTHIRFFTYANCIKLLLDAGFIPKIVSQISGPSTNPGLVEALLAAAVYMKQDPWRFSRYLATYQYIFHGVKNPAYAAPLPPPFPISFIVPTNNERILRDYLNSSPIFRGDHPHQLIILPDQSSAAEAVANGLRQAKHDFVVCLHQDVYLPDGWDALFCQRVLQAEAGMDNVGLIGIYGSSARAGTVTQHGSLIDRHEARIDNGPLPAPVGSLDDCLFGFRKAGFPGMDPALKYHLYATDLLCAYRERGQQAVVVDALCYHNPGLGQAGHPPEMADSTRYLMAKWKKLLAGPHLVVPDSGTAP